jgi:hypothetical protein
MLEDSCTNCINDYISKLPKHTDIAKKGTQIPNNNKEPKELSGPTG